MRSDWQESCLKPYWSLVQKVQLCQETCNTFFFFLYQCHERGKCLLALRVPAHWLSVFFILFSCIQSLNLLGTSLPFLSTFCENLRSNHHSYKGYTDWRLNKSRKKGLFLLFLLTEDAEVPRCFLFSDNTQCLPIASWLQHGYLDYSIRGLKKGEKSNAWCIFVWGPWGGLQPGQLLWLIVHRGESGILYISSSPEFLNTIWHPIWYPNVLLVLGEEQWSELENGHELLVLPELLWSKLNNKDQLASHINLLPF